ncbi:dihydrofolate synthase/folylpolyglutamate synthase [Chromohalobacter marismortui]|uniref:Dihydrofolate synthase/folylpolyglutamate synthase n=1 Tax=Chromohalobacter marismortui TaxID=42055 RepID=A0A4R7NUH8_9GAMM|nr:MULTISPECIES: bifunctional tetrahydrofolate synthase/dihydrofolate synthase [Chromohalobacter]MCI0510648.1 bifunctional tetrahydrofolate synthase/dihydrofolate synthase [Chromohalobacter sp.]MCI0591963.1 bifunctional tetrahydrofolate synthase/dihydrofolate synthase [Chromohalobacter sp.]TDU24775.1 dihydrofolate synthase/folylpolyglutamate synthase [Chromohalobacter marismortui]
MVDTTPLEDWLVRLERQHPVAIDLGLERVTAVAVRLGLNAKSLAGRVITVAGTNGKGSTVAMLDALVREHGWHSAAYTSPHLQRYNERLCFDGQEVDDAALVEAFEAVEAARLADEEISLTYFEVGTLAALWLIKRQQPDIALLEVGLGGRLDAVNVVDPDVAVVTTVAQDHAAFLGTHLDTIGQEKAGIMRSKRPAVLGSAVLPASVRQHADSLEAPVFALGERFGWQDAADGWQWQGETATGEPLYLHALPDPHLPLDNAATALQALTLVGVALEETACRRAFERAILAGRLQWQGAWCLDVGHNPHAAAYMATYLSRRPLRGRRFCLLGMLADKDAKGVIEALASQIDAWVPVSLSGDRARDAEQLAALLSARDAQVMQCAASPDVGVRWLHANMDSGDEVLVCGSFWTVAEASTTLGKLGVMASPRSMS